MNYCDRCDGLGVLDPTFGPDCPDCGGTGKA